MTDREKSPVCRNVLFFFLNPTDWWPREFLSFVFFSGCQPVHRDSSHLDQNPPWPPQEEKKKKNCTNNDFEFAVSGFESSTLTAGITVHYVSDWKGWEGPERGSHRVVGVEIITGADRLPASSVFMFLLSGKRADVMKNTDSAFRTRVALPVPYLKSCSRPATAFRGSFRGRRSDFLHSSLSPASEVKTSPFSVCVKQTSAMNLGSPSPSQCGIHVQSSVQLFK